jgi:hypothetical protein
VAKLLPPPVNRYAFVASTGRSIEHHLLNHRIRKLAADGTTSRIIPRTSGAMARYLRVSTTNPKHQELLSKLEELYNPRISNLLLLDWIVMDNLPFSMVEGPRFRQFVELMNQAAKIPGRSIMRKLLNKEYQLAVPHVRKVLQSALGIIHFTFNSWTSRQNNSFLGVTAHFMDTNWEHRTIFLGLPPLLNSHISDVIADEIAAILRFFGVKDR